MIRANMRRAKKISSYLLSAACLLLAAGGVSNVVLNVEQGDRRLVLKHSRPQLRTREAWFSDIERIWREQEVMEVLHPLLPAGSVPAVLFVERLPVLRGRWR